MPKLKQIGRYRFFFYSVDVREPPHVHVEAAEDTAKVWLAPIRFAWSKGFNIKEQNEILRLIEDNRDEFLQKWKEILNAS